MLSSVLDSNEDINVLTERLIRKIQGCIATTFKKVRVTHNKKGKIEKLYAKLSDLKDNKKESAQEKANKIMEEISSHKQSRYQRVVEEIAKTKHQDKLDQQSFWKIKKKMCPERKDPPSVMFDSSGNILTENKSIGVRALEVYKERLQANKMKDHLANREEEINKLCDQRLKMTRLNKSPPWNMSDLEEAMKDLDRDKSRDALGQANELFKDDTAGSDFKLAILKLMNMIKDRQEYPKAMEMCNITSIYKNKGSHKDFNNYRGIFRVTILRSILDRLMYNDNYIVIDQNLTDGNVGARKHRNVRDNIYVLSAVSNSVVNGKMPPIQVGVTDIEKCFDKLWLLSTINALFDAGLTNDTLNLLYLENKNAQIAIKVNNKLTKRISVKDVIMQGSVWGSIKCSTMVDRLNKAMMK